MEHSHAYSFICYLRPLWEFNASNFNRDCMAHKAKNIYYLAFYRKMLLTSVYMIGMCLSQLLFKKIAHDEKIECSLRSTPSFPK